MICVCAPPNREIISTDFHSNDLIRLHENNNKNNDRKLAPNSFFSVQMKTEKSLSIETVNGIRAFRVGRADLSRLRGLNCLLFKMENIIVCVTTIILH